MLIRRVREALPRLDLEGRGLLVAVSGGIDSVSLLHALRSLSQRHGLKLLIGHVNHGLRGAESEADQAFVEALGPALSVDVETARVDPAAAREGGPSRDRPSLQEAARDLRYAALAAMAETAGLDRIVTAHTADDQAETVLLRLLRGTGPDGLGGIPELSPDGRLARPLLDVSRDDVERFARGRGIAWREDASNATSVYTRNRLRHHWLPGLASEFNPRLLRAIGSLAEAQRRDSEWIAGLVEREAGSRFVVEGGWLRIDAKDWRALPEPLARRLARAALERCGSARLASRVHLDRMGEFLRSGRPGSAIELPGDLTLRRDRRGVRLGPLRSPPASPNRC